FCWGRVKGFERSGLAHLLHHGQSLATDAEMLRDLERLNAEASVLAIKPFPEAFNTHRLLVADESPALHPQVFQGRINPGWSMISYSRLTAGT
ncbi:hypothetical protein JZU54_04650, partial [bacterium]|nr:hypothetical protein [bacterium]